MAPPKKKPATIKQSTAPKRAPGPRKGKRRSGEATGRVVRTAKSMPYVLGQFSTYAGEAKPKKDVQTVLMNPVTGEGEFTTIPLRIPSLEKVVDEAITNTGDNARSNDATIPQTYVSVDFATNSSSSSYGLIRIENDGEGIPIKKSEETGGMWSIEAAFTTLRTGSNFDPEKGGGAGTFGVGVKVTNFTSSFFRVEVEDVSTQQIYTQTFKPDQQKEVVNAGAPSIKKKKMDKGKVVILFRPNYEWFLKRGGIKPTKDNVKALVESLELYTRNRVAELAFFIPENKILYNETAIDIKSFGAYVKGIIKVQQAEAEEDESESTSKVAKVVQKFTNGWEVWAVAPPFIPDTNIVAYVNGIRVNNGPHVKGFTKFFEYVRGKKPMFAKISESQINSQYILFLNASVPNAKFTDLTKIKLARDPTVKYPTKAKLLPLFKKMYSTLKIAKRLEEKGLVDALVGEIGNGIKKVSGSKRIRYTEEIKGRYLPGNMKKFKESLDRVLLIVEGESASKMPETGRGSIDNGGRYSIFMLRGKIFNPRSAAPRKLLNKFSQMKSEKRAKFLRRQENDIIVQLILILGMSKLIGIKKLTAQLVKNVREDLNFGKIYIMTDQDVDGYHIRGLLLNLFNFISPVLFGAHKNRAAWNKKLFGQAEYNMLNIFSTPIVRATVGDKTVEFMSEQEYEKWRESALKKRIKFHASYFKGLGTSSASDAKRIFKNIDHYVTPVTFTEEGVKELDNVFGKDPGPRKFLLSAYNRNKTLDPKLKEIPVKKFIEGELLHFFQDDNTRSLPHIMDGLKPSHRKILFTFRKMIGKKVDPKEIIKATKRNVPPHVGSVMSENIYHHGEASLSRTILGLTYHHVGSNMWHLIAHSNIYSDRYSNVPSAARYSIASYNPIGLLIYPIEDDVFLPKTQTDDGADGEPEYYSPILPMVLITGAEGIGTGWSTSIPPFDVFKLIQIVGEVLNSKFSDPEKLTADNEILVEGASKLNVWIEGFQGTVISSPPEEMGRGKWSESYVIGKYRYDQKKHKLDIIDPPPFDGTRTTISSTNYIFDRDKYEVTDGEGKKKFAPKYPYTGQVSRKRFKNGGAPGTGYTATIRNDKHFALSSSKEVDLWKWISVIHNADRADGSPPSISDKVLEVLKTLKIAFKISTSNMHVISTEDRVVKISTFASVFIPWYVERYRIYQLRKVKDEKVLREKLKELANRRRFIEDCIKGTFKFRNTSKKQLQAQLASMKFDKIDGGFTYLISTPISSQTKDKVAELDKAIERLEKLLDLLLKKTIPQLWLEELENLRKNLVVMYKNRHVEQNET